MSILSLPIHCPYPSSPCSAVYPVCLNLPFPFFSISSCCLSYFSQFTFSLFLSLVLLSILLFSLISPFLPLVLLSIPSQFIPLHPSLLTLPHFTFPCSNPCLLCSSPSLPADSHVRSHLQRSNDDPPPTPGTPRRVESHRYSHNPPLWGTRSSRWGEEGCSTTYETTLNAHPRLEHSARHATTTIASSELSYSLLRHVVWFSLLAQTHDSLNMSFTSGRALFNDSNDLRS